MRCLQTEGVDFSLPGHTDPLSLVVINDVDLVVAGLVSMLEPHSDRVRIAGTIAGELRPIAADVALVDAFGHPNAGVDRLRAVMELGCCRHVVLYTWRLSTSMAVEVVELGGAGILAKSSSSDEIASAIVRIAGGERVIHDFPLTMNYPSTLDVGGLDLTDREIELLVHVARGHNNARIGEAMFLAESTIKTYLKRVYRKLGVNSRAQAVMRAVELGIARKDNVTDLR